MESIVTKDDLVRTLTEAGIEFDPEAAVANLRHLYDELVCQLPNRKNSSESSTAEEKTKIDGWMDKTCGLTVENVEPQQQWYDLVKADEAKCFNGAEAENLLTCVGGLLWNERHLI